MANTKSPIKDTDYDLISVVYHAAQGAETSSQYANDAKQAGRQDVASYFEEAGRQYVELAKKGRELLKQQRQ